MTFSSADSQTTPRYTWTEIWTAVLTRPSVQTFQEILNDPAVSRRRAYTWMLATWAINALFIGLLRAGATNDALGAMPSSSRVSPAAIQGILLSSAICAIPLALVMGFIGFRITVGLVKFAARRLGGELNYASGFAGEKAKNSDFAGDKNEIGTLLTYSFAAIQAPLNIVTLLFAALPANAITGLISLAATVYQIYLMALSLRTIYGFSMGRAVSSVILAFLLFLLGIFVTVFVVVYLLEYII